jgi:hypothetical protein
LAKEETRSRRGSKAADIPPVTSTSEAEVLSRQESGAAVSDGLKKSAIDRIREEFEEPAIVIVGHGLLIVFGVLVLSLLAWIIEHSLISDTAKSVLHRLDEYLMVFAFLLLGVGFIIKIALVVGGVFL